MEYASTYIWDTLKDGYVQFLAGPVTQELENKTELKYMQDLILMAI